MSEENFDDIDEHQAYNQGSHRLGLDLHIRPPETPRSLQASPQRLSELTTRLRGFKPPARVPQQVKKPGSGSISPHRTTTTSASPHRTFKDTKSLKKGVTTPTASTANRPSPPSSRTKRTTKVDDHLYQDALRRLHKPQSPPIIPHKPAISPKSEELLADALIREIDCAWVHFSLRARAGILDLGNLLTETRFLQGTETDLLSLIWTTLKGDELGYVSKQTVLNFLFALHMLKCPQKSVDTEATDTDFTVIHFEDGKTLRSRFKLLLDNKKKSHFKPKPMKTDFSFRPALSPGSKKIAEKWSKPRPNSSSEPLVVRLKTKKPQKTSESDLSNPAEMTFKPHQFPPPGSKPTLRELSEEIPEMLRVLPTGGQSFVEPREAEEPIVLLNVTLPSEETVQFPLYFGDPIEEKIREFAEMKGLERNEERKILAEVKRIWPCGRD